MASVRGCVIRHWAVATPTTTKPCGCLYCAHTVALLASLQQALSVSLTHLVLLCGRLSPHHCAGGAVQGLELPSRVFPCATPAEVRSTLPPNADVLAFQCRNPIHRAHYELFIRALDAPNVQDGAVCLVHPTCGPTQVRGKTAASRQRHRPGQGTGDVIGGCCRHDRYRSSMQALLHPVCGAGVGTSFPWHSCVTAHLHW
jgi:hypothetical protein